MPKSQQALRDGVENVWRNPSLLHRTMGYVRPSLREREAVWLLATALASSPEFAADLFLEYATTARDGAGRSLGGGPASHAWEREWEPTLTALRDGEADEALKDSLSFWVATELVLFEHDRDPEAMPEAARRLAQIDLTLAVRRTYEGKPGSGATAQLLLEAKKGDRVDKIKVWPEHDAMPQPVLYAALWETAPPRIEADIRVVGTVGVQPADAPARYPEQFQGWWSTQGLDPESTRVAIGPNLGWEVIRGRMSLHPGIAPLASHLGS